MTWMYRKYLRFQYILHVHIKSWFEFQKNRSDHFLVPAGHILHWFGLLHLETDQDEQMLQKEYDSV